MYYWFHIDGQVEGPLGADSIAFLVEEGRIGADTLGWAEGMETWAEAGDIEPLVELFPALARDAPEPIAPPRLSLERPERRRRERGPERGYERAPDPVPHTRPAPVSAPAPAPQPGDTLRLRDPSPRRSEPAALLDDPARAAARIHVAPRRGARRRAMRPLVASMWERTLAGLVDLVLLCGLFTLMMVIVVVAHNYASGRPTLSQRDALALTAWLVGAGILGAATYYLAFMSRLGEGQTPGYRLAGLKLVDQTTGACLPPGRLLLWYVTSFLHPIGWLWYYFDDRLRMLHNVVSRSIVVRVRVLRMRGLRP